MSYKVGATISEAVDRLTTQAGAVIVGVLALFSILRAAAGQDILRGAVESILAELETTQYRDSLGPNQLEALESAEAELEALIVDLPLALGLSPTLAGVLWLFAYVLGLVVAVIALDTFGHKRDTLSGLETERIGSKVLNLFLGSIVFGVLFAVGLILLVIPGLLVLVFLFLFPAAIVLDDQSFFTAFSTSAGIVKRNFLSTLGLLVATLVLLIILSIVGTVVSGVASGVPGAIVDEVFSAIGTAIGFAVIASAYVATRE